MKIIKGGLGRGGIRFLSTMLMRRRSRRRGDWLRILLLTNLLLCFGLVVLYILRNHPIG
jgi:hypothetical protein